MSASMDQSWRLTVLLHLLQTGINLLGAVSRRFHSHNQELMNLHKKDLEEIPMLLLVEVEGMVGLVAMMDHYHALRIHFLLEDFQRIAGVQ